MSEEKFLQVLDEELHTAVEIPPDIFGRIEAIKCGVSLARGTLTIPDFEAAYKAEETLNIFYKEVDKYMLRLSCRPAKFLGSIPEVYEVLNNQPLYCIEDVQEVITSAEEAWEDWPDKSLDDAVRL